MEKVIRPGIVKTYGGRNVSVFIKIKFDDGDLSLTGVVGPTPSGNAYGSAGQINMGFRDGDEKITNYAPKWDAAMFKKLLDIWSRWHLNDMRAGTPAQEEHLRVIHGEYPGYPKSHYEWALEELGKVGLNPDPETGYRYGSAWLKEEVPQDVIDWLFNLPDADRTPAWI